MSILTMREPGKKVLATGAQAFARGGLEAGIGFFATYPGTPASGVGDSIAEVHRELEGLYFEYSMNEKVATEGAIGAAWGGVRAMVAMKLAGFNVASDTLFTVTRGEVMGLVIVHGSDPGQQSSGTEQDNRFYAPFMHFPMLQPSSVQEAKNFVLKAFELSERFIVPCIIDAPSALLHGSGELELGLLPQTFPAAGELRPHFVKTIHDINLGRPGRHRVLLMREAGVRDYVVNSDFNRVVEGHAEWGIITSGTAFGYTMEALNILGIENVPVLKLGMVYPLSPEYIGTFLKGLKRVIIVEEGDGFLEGQIKAMAYDLGLNVPLVGKEWFSSVGMLSPSRVAVDLSKGLGLPLPEQFEHLPSEFIEDTERLGGSLAFPSGGSIPMPLFEAPRRIRTFCVGCPHRAVAYGIKKATKGKHVIGTDIGCYAMMEGPPFHLGDFKICMGGGIGAAQGLSRKIHDAPVIAFIGDSTLFHAGLPSVMNAAYYDAHVLLIVLDNRWTAMTGHQPTPSTQETPDGKSVRHVDIPKLLRGLGVTWVKSVNPFRPDRVEAVVKEALKQPGFKAMVTKGECMLQRSRRNRILGVEPEITYRIDPDKCRMCDICFADFGCPAIVLRQGDDGGDMYHIDAGLCTQCGACARVCPFGAIVGGKVRREKR
jgi:indolepyruvate ferredoxin oxidoreductase alpha subunit